MESLGNDEKRKFVEEWNKKFDSMHTELDLLRNKLDETELTLTLDEKLKAIDLTNQKFLRVIDEAISLMPLNEKVAFRFYRSIMASFFSNLEALLFLFNETTELREGLDSITADLSKIKGSTVNIESLKSKLGGANADFLVKYLNNELDSLENFPFKQIAIQFVQGNNYGSLTQAVESKEDFNIRVNNIFKQSYELVDKKTNVLPDQKEEIKKNLKTLEKELQNKEPDEGKIKKLWTWIKENASWIAPKIAPIIDELAKKVFGV